MYKSDPKRDVLFLVVANGAGLKQYVKEYRLETGFADAAHCRVDRMSKVRTLCLQHANQTYTTDGFDGSMACMPQASSIGLRQNVHTPGKARALSKIRTCQQGIRLLYNSIHTMNNIAQNTVYSCRHI